MNKEEDFKKVWSTQLTPKLRTNILPAINSVVEDWGTEEEKKIHTEGAHSALVDPLVLGMISIGMLGGTLDIDINTVKFRFG